MRYKIRRSYQMAPKCLRTLQNMMRHLLLLPIIGLSLVLAACTSAPTENPRAVAGGPLFTINGWDILLAPSVGYMPGTIFSVDPNGRISIERHLFDPPRGKDQEGPSIDELKGTTNIEVDANGSILGTFGANVRGNYSFEANAHLRVPGSRVIYRPYDDMDGSLGLWLNNPRRKLEPTRRYYLVTHCLKAKRLNLSLESTNARLGSVRTVVENIGGSFSVEGTTRKSVLINYSGRENIVVAIQYRMIGPQSPASGQPVR
jgi:hypothetical protein